MERKSNSKGWQIDINKIISKYKQVLSHDLM